MPCARAFTCIKKLWEIQQLLIEAKPNHPSGVMFDIPVQHYGQGTTAMISCMAERHICSSSGTCQDWWTSQMCATAGSSAPSVPSVLLSSFLSHHRELVASQFGVRVCISYHSFLSRTGTGLASGNVEEFRSTAVPDRCKTKQSHLVWGNALHGLLYIADIS